MRKLLISFVAAFSITAAAQSLPTIIGFIPNRAAGQIVLTSETCKSAADQKFVFIKDDGGKLSLIGCWKLIDSDVIVRWSDGDVYSYDVASVVFTPDFEAWYSKRDKTNGQQL